jgi:adhesin/invasin
MAFDVTFDFSSLSLTLPDQVIFGVAYNTQSAGQSPIGVNGPYNDLNVGLNASNTVGNNLSAPTAYLKGTIDQAYADKGAGGINVFRLDVGGIHTTIAIEFNAPGSPASITVTGGGTQSTTVGTAFGHPLQVKVTDVSGKAVPGVTVTFMALGSGASATLSATSVTTDSNGVASVTATANTTPGTYTVTASAAGVTPSATFNLTNLAGPVNYIAFVQQPSNTPAGNPIGPAGPVTVELIDFYQNPIPNVSVKVELAETGVPLGGTLTQTTNASGIATFGDLKITSPGTYHLDVEPTGGVGPSTISNAFNITAGSAVSITALSGGGQTATVGSAYAAPLKALVEDTFMNPVQGASVTFAAPGSGASITFGGSVTVTTDANGEATSSAMTANGQAGSFQVTASTMGAATPATFSLANMAGAVNTLAFIQQPTDTAAHATITPPVTVQLEDSSGNPVHTANVAVTLQVYPVAAHMLAPLSFAAQNTDANGLATFPSLSISQVGQYQLLAESSGIASATSNSFNIVAGQGANINTTGGVLQSAFVLTAFGAPLQATVTDAVGNPVAGVPVVFAAPTTGPSGTFGGQLMVTANTDLQGHAQAVITANNIAGSYLVTATSTLITGSASFSLTNLPLNSTVLRFMQQPSNTPSGQVIAPPVTVQIQNSSGSASNTAGLPIVLSLSSGTGTLLGTVVQLTDVTGTASFNDLHISAVGPKQFTAASASQPSAVSFTFQITAGAPATMTAVSGTPQLTTVSTPFPMLLQAQVLDIAGNPVPGVSATFTAPASGASATFAATPTVVTDSSGIATAPPLTANSTVGSFAVIASAAGVSGQAAFSLTNLPPRGSLTVNPSRLGFISQFNGTAPPGQTVQVSSAGVALSWSTSPSAPWITVSPSSGNTPTTATISVNPAGLAAGNYSGSVVFTSPSAVAAAVQVTYTIGANSALVITPANLVFTTSSATITPSPQTLTTASSSGPISYSVMAQVATPTGGSWLKVSPGSGQTGGSVSVSVNPAGLSEGIYNGAVLFTPTDNTINSVTVPVTLIVGCAQGGCTLEPIILAVVNGASFHPGGAPGAIMTIFGLNLSEAIYQATLYPLPITLGPTSVTVNGIVAPLFYASPTQINFQMPSGVPPTGVSVVVNNAAEASRYALKASQGHATPLTVVDPGLFVTPDHRASALNGDLSMHTALTPVPAGGYIILYMTGQGPVTPPVGDGEAAPASPLSIIDAPVQISIGGEMAQVTYQGLAPGYAGLVQLNVIVPSGLTPGDQSVFITINGSPSNAGVITVK